MRSPGARPVPRRRRARGWSKAPGALVQMTHETRDATLSYAMLVTSAALALALTLTA